MSDARTAPGSRISMHWPATDWPSVTFVQCACRGTVSASNAFPHLVAALERARDELVTLIVQDCFRPEVSLDGIFVEIEQIDAALAIVARGAVPPTRQR
jgi:hypothetical protein